MADFNHSPQAQVVKILIKHPISSDRKKGFNEFTKQNIFTRNKYEKQIVDKKQAKTMNLTQVLFCIPSKKGITIILL